MPVLLAPCVFAGKPITLASNAWTLILRPETMYVTARLAGLKEPLVLSGPQSARQRVDRLRVTTREAKWRWTDSHLTVSVKLNGDTLAVEFATDELGEITWPILPAQTAVRGYILPFGEGVYAPCVDPEWRAYLKKQEGMSTTEGLSMPVWGLDFGSKTVTYLLTNPFNNELVLHDESRTIAARLTHRFTPRGKARPFGVRISLGAASPVEPARRYRHWLQSTGQFVSLREKIKNVPGVAKLLGAAHVYLWGDGISQKMIQTLKGYGFDRLWLGSPGWKELRENPRAVADAKAAGYLIGPYDSYHSIHFPDEKPEDTWETAQFDRRLYETGAVVLWNGKKRPGFQRRGYKLSPLAARPYVEKRVRGLMREFRANSWFIDCDAFGEVFDDYSPLHPASQSDDAQARLRRMAWIRDTYKLVVGSEGGSAYAASTIHFAHGMTNPGFGWGDADLNTNRNSPYYLGAYFPPDAPTLFFKQARLKPSYYHCTFDPRFRLPLYQTAFHDSLVTTHHWSSPTLKFRDQIRERSLVELLHGVPPLYHLNTSELRRNGAWIKRQYAFFTTLHRQIALLPLTGFSWLTRDHRVQRTTFGGQIECVANFRPQLFIYRGHRIPARSLLTVDKQGGAKVFIP